MIEYIKDPDVWLSIIAIAVSVIALWQTQKQIKLSNKQHLLDRRLSAYSIIKDLLDSYKAQKDNCSLADDNDFIFKVGIAWYNFMGILYLEPVANAIEHPAGSPEGRAFSIKMAELVKKAEEIKLIFPSKVSEPLADFISAYVQAMRTIYRYLLVTDFARKDPVLKDKSIKEKIELIGEPTYRSKVLDSLSKLDCSYQKLLDQDSEEQMKNCIRL